MAQHLTPCPTCGQEHSWYSHERKITHCLRCGAPLSSKASKGPYATLFERYAYYTLPDGTDVQAQWSEDDPLSQQQIDDGVTAHYGPFYWRLVPDNRPSAPGDPFIQYRVEPDGHIIEERYIALKPHQPIETFKSPEGPALTRHTQHQRYAKLPIIYQTDLTIDDIIRER